MNFFTSIFFLSIACFLLRRENLLDQAAAELKGRIEQFNHAK